MYFYGGILFHKLKFVFDGFRRSTKQA